MGGPAQLLDLPQLTRARKLQVDGQTVTIERETDDGISTLSASMPAVVSVNEKINDPRYPSFKGIMAAKKKPVSTLSLAEAGIDASEVGLDNAMSRVLEVAPRPARTAGQKVEDDGNGGRRIAEYLIAQKLV